MNPALSVALLVALSCLLPAFSLFQNQKIPVKSIVNQVDEYGVPANGIIDYIGKSSVEKGIRLEESLVNISLAYFLHSFTHSLIHSLTHSLTHSFTHSLIHSLIHSFIKISRFIVQQPQNNHGKHHSIYFANYLGKKLVEDSY